MNKPVDRAVLKLEINSADADLPEHLRDLPKEKEVVDREFIETFFDNPEAIRAVEIRCTVHNSAMVVLELKYVGVKGFYGKGKKVHPGEKEIFYVPAPWPGRRVERLGTSTSRFFDGRFIEGIRDFEFRCRLIPLLEQLRSL